MLHILFTLSECDKALLDNEEYICRVLYDACGVAGATWLKTCSHKFDPQVSGVHVLYLRCLCVQTFDSFLLIHTDNRE